MTRRELNNDPKDTDETIKKLNKKQTDNNQKKKTNRQTKQ